MDLKDLINRLQSDPNVKITTNCVPFEQNIKILDVSLVKRSGEEDKIYQQNEFLLKNLRRGTSFLTSASEFHWARKGLPKFFPISSAKLRDFLSQTSFFPISDTIESLKTKQTVSVFRTNKANGENAQISYSKNTDSWIIGSKNVCLAARKTADLDLYTTLRYNFAKMIGKVWFDIISQIPSKEISSLIEICKDSTLIGEYVGNPDCQHVIKYQKETILFFSIVKHDSAALSLDPHKAFEIFTKLGLPFVKFEKICDCNDLLNFISILNELTKRCEELSLEQEGEGCVLYFSNNEFTLNLCKIKTIEYKILRKIREKARNISGQVHLIEKSKADIAAYISKFSALSPSKIEYFVSLSKEILQPLLSNPINIKNLQNNFSDLISNTENTEIYISIGIPGIGKSTLISKLREKFNNLNVISSDAIRGKLIEELKTKNQQLSESQLFSQTGAKSKEIFDQEIKKASGKVYIDKNFPPNSIQSLIKLVGNANAKIVAFIPDCKELNLENFYWPMSLEVLYTCMLRILNRNDHTTLNGSAISKIGVLFMMYGLYRGFNFNYYLKQGVSKLIKVNFVDENLIIPENIKEKICEVLKNIKPGKFPNENEIQNILDLIPNTELTFPDLIFEEKIQEIPLFLGVKLENCPIFTVIVPALASIFCNFPENSNIFDHDLLSMGNFPFSANKKIINNWKFPNSLHITTLYIGKNSKVLHSSHYNSFIENIEYEIVPKYLVYIPGKIIIITVEFLQNSPSVANKVPHITALLGQFPSKSSNTILESIDLNPGIQKLSTSKGEAFTTDLPPQVFFGTSTKFYN